ncbi:substrate-binding periplasmic protein [Pseudoduganella namucuonensis]|uniref:Amino acid ABC transporter substrate-binding protein, PAAT family n=1 Tax=Pseudoduganella namucuonensis TaxID=1035707 RepID=A0A1I7M6C7_9BURK|nr:transporter substrate-binding domain-containing protein [Pseudoduganella namucuonensis]SFV17511.1 amino acid ABC transporter substrate-binding protein, PAAT family [Pseudoduganella namucuonensis]
MKRILSALLALGAVYHGAAVADGGDIVFIAPTNHTMPMARFEEGRLAGGLLKELGELMAVRMGLRARFLSVPSRRVGEVLTAGGADALCYVLPAWIDGDYHWSKPFLPNAGVVAARPEAPVIGALEQLAGIKVGTVNGYRYPDLERALGKRFAREDAPTMELNFRKLVVGRMRYAIMEQTTLDYQLRKNPALKLRKDLQFSSFQTQCAFARNSAIPYARAALAIEQLVADGSIAALLARYR